jgi:dihydrofolate synthase/folylpolyglutamate synthase
MEASTFLLGLPRFSDLGTAAFKPGVERIVGLLDLFGRPDRDLRVLHVAGTNGKGSVASMIAAISTAAGLRTGLHTSPHLFSVAERLRVDGTPASRTWLNDTIDRFGGEIESLRPSFFETTVALSLKYFAEMEVDLAVVEVGLGGRLDATNILDAELAVVTNIGLEHTEILGETIEQIGREKAGIIKRGQIVVSGVTQPEARAVLEEVARGVDARIEHVSGSCQVVRTSIGIDETILDIDTPVAKYSRLRIPVPGEHQVANATLAIRAAEIMLEARVESTAIREGLSQLRQLSGLRARMERLSDTPMIFADVAHNPDGLRVALGHLERWRTGKEALYVALSFMKDKDVQAMGRLLRDHGAVVRTVPLHSDRAEDPAALANRLKDEGVVVDTAHSVRDVIAWFLESAEQGDILLLTGSHQIMEEAQEFFPECRSGPIA